MEFNMAFLKKLMISFFLLLVGFHQSYAEPIQVATLNYPPFQYMEGGKIQGIAAKLVKEAFKRANVPVKIDFFPFPRAYRNIQVGESDVIFTFYYKKEREKYAYYSKETLVNQTISLFVPRTSNFHFDGDLTKLSLYSFGVIRFSYGKVLDTAIKNGTLRHIQYVSRMESNMLKFLRHRFDILPSDRYVALYYYSKVASAGSERIKELHPEVESFPTYIGYSKANKLSPLRDQIDRVLKEMKADGTYQSIINNEIKSWGIDLNRFK